MKGKDCHAHVIPRAFSERVEEGAYPGISFENGAEGKVLSFGGRQHPYTPLFHDLRSQLGFMDSRGIDLQAVSITPRLFFYDWEPEAAAEICRLCNDEIIDTAAGSAGRIAPVGALPMQSVKDALAELEHLESRGVRMVQIGTMVGSRRLDDPVFRAVYERIAAFGVVLMLHPLIENKDPATKSYHLSNAVGNPFQTTAAAANLIMSGMLDAVPDLKVLLVHGAGYLPYQIGRMDHVFRARGPEDHPCSRLPSEYLRRNFWSDGLTHGADALRFLMEVMGEDRVLFGTDYPYDMADYTQLENLRALGYGEDTVSRVMSENFDALISG